MRCSANWQETESKVFRPGTWIAYLVGGVFVLFGGCGFITLGAALPNGFPVWGAELITGTFAVAGVAILLWALSTWLRPVSIRHAVNDSISNVSNEPVIRDGSVVHGRLTHELLQTAEGWVLAPAESVRRNDRRFLLGFGIPFLSVSSGLLTWTFNQTLNNVPLSAISAIFITAICGGTCFTIIGLVLRAGFRRLSRLTIPVDRTALRLESTLPPRSENPNPADGWKWLLQGEGRKQQLLLPREHVVAVQLCPWKVVMGGPGHTSTSWAVQGLLVVHDPDTAAYERHPCLLTSDYVGAARLLRELAAVLQVPYLFGADAEGWRAETIRAKTRPPLQSGGYQS